MSKLRSFLNFFAAAGAIALITLGSCNKSKDEVIEDITPVTSANIDGVDWSTNISAGVSTSLFIITATKDKEAIVLTVPTKDVGVYPIDLLNNPSNLATYTPILDSIDAAYIAYEGSIEITEINALRTQIQGNFNFKAINATTLDTISVTQGILKNIPTK